MIDPGIPQHGVVPVTQRTLRQFAGIWLVFFLGLAGWQGFLYGRTALATVCAAVGVIVGSMGLLRPAAIRPVYKGMVVLTYPIGWVVSHLSLAFLYYGLFTPTGLLFRLFGRDALARRRREKSSYWAAKPMPTDVRRYFRQF